MRNRSLQIGFCSRVTRKGADTLNYKSTRKKTTTLFSLLCFPSKWQLQTHWKPVTRTSSSLDDGEQLVWSPEFTGKMDETQSHCEFPFWLLCLLQIVFGGFQMLGLLHGGDLCEIIIKATSAKSAIKDFLLTTWGHQQNWEREKKNKKNDVEISSSCLCWFVCLQDNSEINWQIFMTHDRLILGRGTVN